MHCPGSARAPPLVGSRHAPGRPALSEPCQAAGMGWWGRGRVRGREGRDGVGGLAVRDGGSRSESSRPPCRNSCTIIQPRNPPPPPPPPLERQRMLRRTGEREGRRTGERKGRCTGEREGRRAEGTGRLASGGAERPAHERTGRRRGREGWRAGGWDGRARGGGSRRTRGRNGREDGTDKRKGWTGGREGRYTGGRDGRAREVGTAGAREDGTVERTGRSAHEEAADAARASKN